MIMQQSVTEAKPVIKRASEHPDKNPNQDRCQHVSGMYLFKANSENAQCVKSVQS